MLSVCLYLHVHQPYRIKNYGFFSIGEDHNYFNENHPTNKCNNAFIFRKVAEKSYLPTNAVLQELLDRHPEFRVSLSLSGVFLEQAKEFGPDVLESFQRLVATGRVDIVAETYYHSLAFFYSRPEFERHVQKHRTLVKELFNYEPTVFRNTELAYTNSLAKWAEEAGYKGILAEGWDPILGWRSPNFVYRPAGTKSISLLLKNYRLSDDVAFRFGEKSWSEWPLDVDKYSTWVHANHGAGETVNLFMDYETFGEHQWHETGIFDFLRALPSALMRHPDTTFRTTHETATELSAKDEVDVPHIITWADTERDLTAWTGNDIQRAALSGIYALEEKILESGDDQLIEDWRRLQTSDHFYYMCTKWWHDGDVHAYFSPYESPYDAYTAFMNALQDVKLRLREASSAPITS